MQNYLIKIRLSESDDMLDIWKWRNDPHTKLMSGSMQDIAWNIHTDWYKRLIESQYTHIYIGYLDETRKVGICRFDINPHESYAEISINLNPSFRGKKISHALLKNSIAIFNSQYNLTLKATIKRGNFASVKCFTSSGFILDREDSEYYYYKKYFSNFNNI